MGGTKLFNDLACALLNSLSYRYDPGAK